MKRLFLLTAIFVSGLGFAASLALAHHEDKKAPTATFATGNKIDGSFTLVNQDGKIVTDKDFGKNKLIYFGFTSCPDTCPVTLHKIAKAVQMLGDKANSLDILFITTDPERDTPKAMKDYLAAFRPVVITGLTGTPAQIKDIEKKYKVYAEKIKSDSYTGYLMSHSSVSYLVGADGTLLDMIGNDSSADDMLKDLKSKI